MTVDILRKNMMLMKKENPEKAKVLQAILSSSQLIAKEDGNRAVTEQDIISAAKKEMKMAEQSKSAGAPFNKFTFEICEAFLPPRLNEFQTKEEIMIILDSMEDKSIKQMGAIIKKLTEKFGESVDKALVSKMLKEILS